MSYDRRYYHRSEVKPDLLDDDTEKFFTIHRNFENKDICLPNSLNSPNICLNSLYNNAFGVHLAAGLSAKSKKTRKSRLINRPILNFFFKDTGAHCPYSFCLSYFFTITFVATVVNMKRRLTYRDKAKSHHKKTGLNKWWVWLKSIY